VGQTDRLAGDRQLDRLSNVGGRNSGQGGLLFVDHETQRGLLRFDVPVEVDHAGGRPEDALHLLGQA